jgi:hypothetical protein
MQQDCESSRYGYPGLPCSRSPGARRASGPIHSRQKAVCCERARHRQLQTAGSASCDLRIWKWSRYDPLLRIDIFSVSVPDKVRGPSIFESGRTEECSQRQQEQVRVLALGHPSSFEQHRHAHQRDIAKSQAKFSFGAQEPDFLFSNPR